MITDYDELLQQLEREARERNERVRCLIIEAGRKDLLAEYDRNMKEIANGAAMARSCWHSISSAQRFTLRVLGEGRYLARSLRSKNQFDAIGRAPVTLAICRLSTARKLCAHGLIHVNGGATDPEAMFCITERGHFVLKHGQPT